MHFETLAPLWPIILIGLACLPIITLAALISRHRLAKRHQSLKATLNRVSGERDQARFGLRKAANIFDRQSPNNADAHDCRVAAGDLVGEKIGRVG